MKLKESTGGNFESCPEYTGKAVCVDVTPTKKVNTQFGDREVFKLVFEVELKREDGSPFAVWSKGFTPSLHEKSSLRKFLRGWFGHDLTKDELQDFETETLLGRPAFLVVTHAQVENEIYANIASCTPDKSGHPLAPSGKFIRAKDRPPKDGNGGGGGYRRVEQEKAASEAPATVDHAATKVHVGKCKGLELRDLSPDQVKKLMDSWLPEVLKTNKPTADDRRLIAALEWYENSHAQPVGAEAEDNCPY
jgi:hypothetical protein